MPSTFSSCVDTSRLIASTSLTGRKFSSVIVYGSVADPDPNPDPSDPYVLGLLDPDPLVRGMDLDPDPHQNVMDPQHWGGFRHLD